MPASVLLMLMLFLAPEMAVLVRCMVRGGRFGSGLVSGRGANDCGADWCITDSPVSSDCAKAVPVTDMKAIVSAACTELLLR